MAIGAANVEFTLRPLSNRLVDKLLGGGGSRGGGGTPFSEDGNGPLREGLDTGAITEFGNQETPTQLLGVLVAADSKTVLVLVLSLD